MTTYIIRRIMLMIPTIVMVTVLVFLIVRLLPGDAVETIIGQYTPLTNGERAQRAARAGPRPALVRQYGSFVGGALHGDFGRSLQSQHPISDDLKDRLPGELRAGRHGHADRHRHRDPYWRARRHTPGQP